MGGCEIREEKTLLKYHKITIIKGFLIRTLSMTPTGSFLSWYLFDERCQGKGDLCRQGKKPEEQVEVLLPELCFAGPPEITDDQGYKGF
jgi:hypothetical protein